MRRFSGIVDTSSIYLITLITVSVLIKPQQQVLKARQAQWWRDDSEGGVWGYRERCERFSSTRASVADAERADGPPRLMQRVAQRYVQYVNRTYQRAGTLWEGRFRSCLVDAESYPLACQRYIELNPVRAQMVAHPGDYKLLGY